MLTKTQKICNLIVFFTLKYVKLHTHLTRQISVVVKGKDQLFYTMRFFLVKYIGE
jgi:hypothetical protein